MQSKGSYVQRSYVIPSMSDFDFIKKDKITKVKINKKAEIGSVSLAPLPSKIFWHTTPDLSVKLLPIR